MYRTTTTYWFSALWLRDPIFISGSVSYCRRDLIPSRIAAEAKIMVYVMSAMLCFGLCLCVRDRIMSCTCCFVGPPETQSRRNRVKFMRTSALLRTFHFCINTMITRAGNRLMLMENGKWCIFIQRLATWYRRYLICSWRCSASERSDTLFGQHFCSLERT